jgi:hypothetical protein
LNILNILVFFEFQKNKIFKIFKNIGQYSKTLANTKI